MKNLDTRVQYTKSVMHQALLDIMEEKPIAKITVKELMERAGLNRGTFYLHYTQPSDVLEEIEDEFMEGQAALFTSTWQEGSYQEVMASLFSWIVENQKLAKILMGKNGDPSLEYRLQAYAKETIIREWLKEKPHYNREKLEYLYEFLATGSMHMILLWLENGKNLSPEVFARRMERLGHYCLLSLEEF